MEFLLFSDIHKAWLAAIIDSRDRMNHCQEGGLKIENFAVFRNPDGTVHVPMWSDVQELGAAMDVIWSNFFQFIEDFISLSLHFRIIEEMFSIFKQQEPVSSPKSSWKILDKATADEFIKRVGATPV